jgi:hypothetical protein
LGGCGGVEVKVKVKVKEVKAALMLLGCSAVNVSRTKGCMERNVK